MRIKLTCSLLGVTLEHNPPLVFNVTADPGEGEPVTVDSGTIQTIMQAWCVVWGGRFIPTDGVILAGTQKSATSIPALPAIL